MATNTDHHAESRLGIQAGFGGFASIVVPSIPSAAGVTVVAQGAIFGAPGPLGFDLSNGVLATAGF